MDEELKQILLKMKELKILRITNDFNDPHAKYIEVWHAATADGKPARCSVIYPVSDLD